MYVALLLLLLLLLHHHLSKHKHSPQQPDP
jgi:hypothetical protein